MRWTRQIRSEAQNLGQPLPCPHACNLIVVTYPGCGYYFAGSPTRIPTARNIEGPQYPIEMTNIWAPAFTKFLTQTTRRVHRLAAILLRRWQAEEIAKTPFPCVSRIRTNDHVWRFGIPSGLEADFTRIGVTAPITFTPKRLATRGTGQAGTQRAAEHGLLTIYPTRPVAHDHC